MKISLLPFWCFDFEVAYRVLKIFLPLVERLNEIRVCFYKEHPHMMDVSRKSYLAGNTWTTNHCGEDVNLDAGGSVTGIVGSSAPLREIREKPSKQPVKEGTNTFAFESTQPLTSF